VNDPDVFDDVAAWIPVERRESYWRHVARMRDLSPGDPALEFCLAMGILAVIARQVPGELAAERQHWAKLFSQAHEQTLALAEQQNKKTTETVSSLTIADAKMSHAVRLIEGKAAEVTTAIRLATNGIDATGLAEKIAAKFEESVVTPVQKGSLAVERIAKNFDLIRLGFHLHTWLWMLASAVLLAFVLFNFSWHQLSQSYDEKLADRMAEFHRTARINADTFQQLNIADRPIWIVKTDGSYQLIMDGVDDAFLSKDGRGVINFRARR
jgi:hypothetical protein